MNKQESNPNIKIVGWWTIYLLFKILIYPFVFLGAILIQFIGANLGIFKFISKIWRWLFHIESRIILFAIYIFLIFLMILLYRQTMIFKITTIIFVINLILLALTFSTLIISPINISKTFKRVINNLQEKIIEHIETKTKGKEDDEIKLVKQNIYSPYLKVNTQTINFLDRLSNSMESKKQISTVFIIIFFVYLFILIIGFSIVFWSTKLAFPQSFKGIENYFDAFFFSSTLIIGYGNIKPEILLAKVFIIAEVFSVILSSH